MLERIRSWSGKLLDFIRIRQVGLMLTLMMCFLSFVMFSWGAAFWLNGLFEMHFDLSSCWQGIAAVTTGLVTVAGFATMPYIRYFISSKYNSEEGMPPEEDKK